MKIYKQPVLLMFFAGVIGLLPAQTRNNLSRGHNESVNIYGSFQPKIGEAFKINLKPEPYTPRFTKVTFDIEPGVSVLPTSIKLKPIKPATLRVGKTSKGFENYVKLGVGSRFSPLAEFYHSSGSRNRYRLDFRFRHYSSFKNIKDYLPSPFTHTAAALSFEKYFRYHSWNINGYYGVNTNRYYGIYLPDYPGNSFDGNHPALKQIYQLAEVTTELKSHYKNNDKLAHTVQLGGYYYFDKFGTSEVDGNLKLDVHKAFPVSRYLDYQQLGLEGNAEYIRPADSSNNPLNNFYFRAMPYFNFKYDFVAFKAGLDFEVFMDDSARLHFYPFLHSSLNLVPEVITLFAGIDGGLRKNSFRTLTEDNPFLSSVPGRFVWTNEKVNIFAGFKGNVAGRFGFLLQYNYLSFDDMPFYDFASPGFTNPAVPVYKNEFIVIYNSGSQNHFEASLNYHEGDLFKVWLKGTYDTYQLKNNAIPYFKPKVQVNFGAAYLINGIIRPRIELWYVGKRQGAVKISGGPALQSVDLDPYLDINAGASYDINRNLSVFLDITNLLNKRYMLYTDYPVGGIQVMGGITYRF